MKKLDFSGTLRLSRRLGETCCGKGNYSKGVNKTEKPEIPQVRDSPTVFKKLGAQGIA